MTIYLIHGWGGSRKSMIPLAKAISVEGFKTRVIELPGHGETDVMPRPWSMKDFSMWIKEQIKEDEFVLIGHSFGGKIILEATTSGIIKPSKIVLINSNGVKPANSIKKAFWKIISRLFRVIDKVPYSKNLKFYVYKIFIGEADYITAEGNMKESFKLFTEEHYDKKLFKIDLPTLIIWGEQDKITPIWMGEILHKGIKNSQFLRFDGSHGLPIKEPKKVGKAVNKFLRKFK